MDSSVSVSLPPPPPPPPPMLNMNATHNNGRSQLLADIRKGATLKTAPTVNDSHHNELSPSDKLKKQTQDLLQAELTSTLKRRKPVVINEPPKYEYPTYDDDSFKNNESSHSTGNSANNVHNANTTTPTAAVVVTKPLNVNAVLSVVTGIKLPDVQYDANNISSAATKTQANDKPKITHGRPNFTIAPMKEANKSNGQPVTSPKVPQIKSPELKDPKLHRPSYFSSTITTLDKSCANKQQTADSATTTGAESQVEKCKSIFLIKSQKSVENDSPKPQKQHQKTELISKFESPVMPLANFPPAVARLPSVSEQKEVIKKKNSVDETRNVSVANKKALFEKPVESIPKTNGVKTTQSNKVILNRTTSNQIPNGKFSTLNSPRIISQANNQQKPGVTTVALNKNTSYGSLGRPSMATVGGNKDRVDHHFERTVHTVNETTTTKGKYETKQFEQKTVVSFSKDLLNAPNKYPDQIRVKKTIVTERSHAINQDNPFNNIRFSIQPNGQVIPKAK
ncbi:uncharacterized protein LOC129574757 [Sitodiplosis mosellana]|uniref:uncharacterized protein LOC129574757 n=1 Tax=Sitodiplosis mosellana TaxID=263140 RepID=UPI00244457A8|nr:uncharacterized protein LOC129574757 [Sitodiplosis mosellana]